MLSLSPLLTNHAVMSRRAWEQTLNMDVVPETWRGVVRCVAGLNAIDGECKKGTLIAAVQLTNGGRRGASENQILETKQADLITEIDSHEDARKKLYVLAPGIPEKLAKINQLERVIALTLTKQANCPDDLRAGAEYVPEGLYFNLSDPDSAKWMRERISKIEEENRLAR